MAIWRKLQLSKMAKPSRNCFWPQNWKMKLEEMTVGRWSDDPFLWMAQLSHGCQVDQDAALAAKAIFRVGEAKTMGKNIEKNTQVGALFGEVVDEDVWVVFWPWFDRPIVKNSWLPISTCWDMFDVQVRFFDEFQPGWRMRMWWLVKDVFSR